jgi:hypothetical protein
MIFGKQPAKICYGFSLAMLAVGAASRERPVDLVTAPTAEPSPVPTRIALRAHRDLRGHRARLLSIFNPAHASSQAPELNKSLPCVGTGRLGDPTLPRLDQPSKLSGKRRVGTSEPKTPNGCEGPQRGLRLMLSQSSRLPI